MVNIHQFEDEDSYDVENPLQRSNAAFNQSSLSRIHPVQNGGQQIAPGESQKLVADFDAFSSDAEKLSAILKCADVEQHKHSLSVDYFHFRKHCLLVPIVIMSLLVAVCGFVAASDIMNDNMRIHDSTLQDFLTILVASFGFLILILTIMGNALDFPSKVKFHRAAADDMKGLCEKVRLYRMERAMDERAKEEEEELRDLFPDDDDDGSSTSSEESSEKKRPTATAIIPHSGNAIQLRQVKKKLKQTKQKQKRQEKLTKTLVKQKVRQAREEQELSKDVITFYGYHTELHQIAAGCRSDVPPCISKFFRVMENRVELMSLSRLGVEEESRMRKNQIVRLCANEIFNEISDYPLWPLLTPNVDRTIECALKRVGQLLNMNYRARLRCKLIPCCPIPLCCKKSRTSNVFAIINEGIDQRELDMMQAERTELVRMENERRAKILAGPEEVLEMKDTIYSEEGGGRGGGSGSRSSRHPDYYAPDRSRSGASRLSRDPEGESYADVATEADETGADMATETSYSFKRSPRVGGRGGTSYAGNHYRTSKALGMYPPQDQSVYSAASGMITEKDDTFVGSSRSYRSGERTATEDEGATSGASGGGEKKKKKKKKKSKKKKKKKSKSKKKEEEYDEEEDYTDYSEEEYTEDEYSEYSEED